MNILNYDIFYRRYGVRIPDQMMLPFMPSIEKFQFPRGSVHHYAHYDSVSDGPSSDEYLYRDISKKILMEHVLTLKAARGSPTIPNVSLMPFVRNFHLRNKRFRFLENAATVTKDDLLLTVVNYDILRHGARYVRNIYSDYNKWWNFQSTVWSKINEVTKNSDRQHFIFAELPKVLPSKNKLNEYSKLFTQAALTSFGGANSWFILELWKWFSEEHRAESMIPTMTQEQLAKVNIVYQESGRFLLINLGVLNKWRFVPMAKPTSAEEKEAYDKHQKQPVKIKPDQLQARFLRMLMTLMSVRTTAPVEVPLDDDLEDNKTSSNTTVDAQAAIRPEDVDTDEVSASDRAAAILSTMEEDLAQLEEIERVSAATNNDENQDRSVSISDFSRDKNPEDIIKEQCNALADAGMMTASEYRRFMTLSENYKAILSPDGKTTLAEYSDVKPEQLVINESKKIPDIKTVVDKSMLKSSLLTFDSEYIKNVLKRDICAMVVNSQKGGFVINKYEVEANESILGKFETHTLRITPVEGEPSILRFKLPVIDEDGVYESKGIKYRMRKQRGD